jgi:prephenate dehydrogenase
LKSLGIVGFGSFGEFMAAKLDPYFKIKACRAHGRAGKWDAPIKEVAACDIVVLSVPLDAYQSVGQKIKPYLSKETLIVDICSVKSRPAAMLRKFFPDNKILATHPMFGPQSAGQSLVGHTIVICPDVSDRELIEPAEKFFKKIGLAVKKMSAQAHDKELAVVQGLTFFIAHSLKDYQLQSQTLVTPSFKKLLDLATLEQQHSPDLFYTVQNGNPNSKAVRAEFIKIAKRLDDEINHHNKK